MSNKSSSSSIKKRVYGKIANFEDSATSDTNFRSGRDETETETETETDTTSDEDATATSTSDTDSSTAADDSDDDDDDNDDDDSDDEKDTKDAKKDKSLPKMVSKASEFSNTRSTGTIMEDFIPEDFGTIPIELEPEMEAETELESEKEPIASTSKSINIKAPPSRSHSRTRQKKRKQKLRRIKICLAHCRFDLVRKVAREYFSLSEVDEDKLWNLFWTDSSISPEKAMEMNVRRFQLINHFPGMNELCRKDLLARNLSKMKRLFQNEYNIYPRTWNLPMELAELQKYAETWRNQTYICKPETGCQGRGIFLIRNVKELNAYGKIVCQLYVSKPFLIDSFKFDLRIYVLVTSIDPLRIYVYKDGLARFATVKYKPPTNTNADNSYMHLTNTSVNKKNSEYFIDDDGGSKRKLSSVYRWLEQNGYDHGKVVQRVDDVIVKTLISAHSNLKHNYRICFPHHHPLVSACFELLGFDILLDFKLKPYILEVNHSPSFTTDSELDREVKENLLKDAFAMLNLARLDRFRVENDDRKIIQERLLRRPSKNKSNSVASADAKGNIINSKKKTDKPVKKKTRPRPGAGSGSGRGSVRMFPWELEHCGGFRLVYPSLSREKYDKYFEGNMPSLYQDTAATKIHKEITQEKKKPSQSRVPSLSQVEKKGKVKLEKVNPGNGTGVRGKASVSKVIKPTAVSIKETSVRSKSHSQSTSTSTSTPTAKSKPKEKSKNNLLDTLQLLSRPMSLEVSNFSSIRSSLQSVSSERSSEKKKQKPKG